MVEGTHPGVLAEHTTIQVTATDERSIDERSMVDDLNDVQAGCPCGGTWVSGVS